MNTETLRLNITDAEALQIKREANREGAMVDICRYSNNLIEIKIHRPNRIIDVTPHSKLASK